MAIWWLLIDASRWFETDIPSISRAHYLGVSARSLLLKWVLLPWLSVCYLYLCALGGYMNMGWRHSEKKSFVCAPIVWSFVSRIAPRVSRNSGDIQMQENKKRDALPTRWFYFICWGMEMESREAFFRWLMSLLWHALCGADFRVTFRAYFPNDKLFYSDSCSGVQCQKLQTVCLMDTKECRKIVNHLFNFHVSKSFSVFVKIFLTDERDLRRNLINRLWRQARWNHKKRW